MSRLARIESAQTGTAKKVLSSVPLQEMWSVTQIYAELTRQGMNFGRRTVEGCLGHLVEVGLVKQLGATFTRVKERERPTQTEIDLEVTPEPEMTKTLTLPVAKPKAADPIERLAALSDRCQELTKALQELSAAVETTALEMDDYVKALRSDSERLRQLQALLKGV